MQIRFFIDKNLLENMAEEEYEAIEMAQDGQGRLYRLRPLMARFMVDEQNKPLSHDAAKRELGRIPMGEFSAVTVQFADAFRSYAVPPVSERPSNSLSEVNSAAPSRVGS